MTLAAGLARTATSSAAARSTWISSQCLDELLRSVEAPIQHWLEEHSRDVVLPPDAASPRVLVLNDVIERDDLTIEIRITAFDQLGMAPLVLLRGGSPLRLALTDDMRRFVDAVHPPNGSPLGVDQFISFGHDQALRVFPTAQDGEIAAIGELINTHEDLPARININTAPALLLAHALRVAGRSDGAMITNARTEGRQASIASGSRSGQIDSGDVLLVAASDLWSFKIDVSIDGVRRSWWCVYQHQTSRTLDRDRRSSQNGASRWLCVQRLLITEPPP